MHGVYSQVDYCNFQPSIGESYILLDDVDQVAPLVAQANAHMDTDNTLAAWGELETALRLNPADPGTLAAKARLDQILAEVEKRDEEAAFRSKLQGLRETAWQLIKQGQSKQALDVIREARQLAPFDLQTLDDLVAIQRKIAEPEVLRRLREEAQQKAEYEEALSKAASETGDAFERLADASRGTAWSDLQHAVSISKEIVITSADSAELDKHVSYLATHPFDRFDGVLSDSFLDLLSGVSGRIRPVPVGPLPIAQRVQRLVEQLDYWEGQQTALEDAAKQEPDPVKREEILQNAEVIQGIKSVASTGLVTIVPRIAVQK
jgi:hypothetical protein